MLNEHYYVYILTNKYNTVLYVGVTNNIARRVYEHKSKLVAGFTSKYNVEKLVFAEAFKTAEEAIVAEKMIKGWTRKKKIALIESMNTHWEEITLE